MRYGKHQKKTTLMTITEKGIKVHSDKHIVINSKKNLDYRNLKGSARLLSLLAPYFIIVISICLT